MGVAGYLRAIWRHIRLVGVCVLLSIVVGSLTTWMTTPKYRASFLLLVLPVSDQGYGSAQLSQQMAKTYARLVRSPEVARDVVARLGLALSIDQVESKLAADALPDTSLVSVTVTDSSHDRAERLAQTVAASFPTRIAALSTGQGSGGAFTVSVAEPPSTPSAPISPRPLSNLAVATVLGVCAGTGAAVLRVRLATATHNEPDTPSVLPVAALPRRSPGADDPDGRAPGRPSADSPGMLRREAD